MDSREVSQAESLLMQQLAELQQEYRQRAEPIIAKLAELEAMKPPTPFIIDYAQTFGRLVPLKSPKE